MRMMRGRKQRREREGFQRRDFSGFLGEARHDAFTCAFVVRIRAFFFAFCTSD